MNKIVYHMTVKEKGAPKHEEHRFVYEDWFEAFVKGDEANKAGFEVRMQEVLEVKP